MVSKNFDQTVVADDHPFMGKYVVEITAPLKYRKACSIARKMNEMVFYREGVDNRFDLKLFDDGWAVLRRLIQGDREGFISTNEDIITGVNNDKQEECGVARKDVPPRGNEKSTA
jgi:hypothetical protein